MEPNTDKDIIRSLEMQVQKLQTRVQLLERQNAELEKMLSANPDPNAPPDTGSPADPAPDNGPRMRQAPNRVYSKPAEGGLGLEMGKDVF